MEWLELGLIPPDRLLPIFLTDTKYVLGCRIRRSCLPCWPLVRYGFTHFGTISRAVWPGTANSRVQVLFWHSVISSLVPHGLHPDGEIPCIH